MELESLANVIYVSSISIVEIMIKASIGKLDVQFDPVIRSKKHLSCLSRAVPPLRAF
jgi:PIN domain nuclease of toxin-antitoxin system